MDSLRWILLIVAVLVIGGLYAWGRREALKRWWYGQREEGHDDSSYAGAEDDQDFAAELKRLRDLMDGDGTSQSHHGLEPHAFAGDAQRSDDSMIEVQVSAPQSVSNTQSVSKPQAVSITGPENADAGSPPTVSSSSRDVLFEGYESVSSPRAVDSVAAEKGSVEYAGSDEMIEIGATPVARSAESAAEQEPGNVGPENATEPADTIVTKLMNQQAAARPEETEAMSLGAEAVSAPRVVGKNPEAGKRKPLPTKEPQFKPVASTPKTIPVQESLDLPEPDPAEDQSSQPRSSQPPAAKPVRKTPEDSPRRKIDEVIFDEPGMNLPDDIDTSGRPGPAPVSNEARAQRDELADEWAQKHPEGATPGLTDLGVKVAGNLSETVTGWGESVLGFCRKHAPKRREETVVETPEEILVVNVLARDGSSFNGVQIRQALNAVGLTMGKSGLYEVLPKNRATTTAVLCVANMLEPGVLTDEVLTADNYTPGLTLFLRLPGPVEGVDALEQLLVTAQRLAQELDGEMRDQHRNVLTKQNMALMYEQVVEHARRMRLALSKRHH